MKLKDIAIFLACYNGEKWLELQINSICNQQNVNKIIYASVDASSDNTLEICQNFAVFNHIVVLPSAGRLGNAATNFFRLINDVNLASFDLVALADQDDIWDADKLSSAIKMIMETGADAYSSNVVAFWPDGKTKLIDKAQTQCKFDYMFESAGPGCTFVLTQKLALHLQTFLIENRQACKNVALHDWFIYAFARTNSYKWVIDNQPHMQYRQHDTNVVGANVGVKAKLNRWNQLRAGWLNTQAILLAEIIGYSDSWVIRRLRRNNFIDKLVLIANVSKFRRKLIDRLALAVSFLVGVKK